MSVVPSEEMESATLNKTINEEYKLWRKNAAFLYDMVITHALEWPSLTVQWLPDRESSPDKDYDVHKLLIGTHTSGAEPNYVQIAHVHMPRFSGSSSKDVKDPAKYDDGRAEYGSFTDNQPRLQVYQSIPHEGEVNRARYMPQNPNLIATKTVAGEVFVFDREKHSLSPNASAPCKPDITLRGHTREGYGIAWAPTDTRKGHLLSASDDETICHWDVTAYGGKANSTLDPLNVYRGHHGVVEDVSWHASLPDVFASCGDDHHVMLWDARSGTAPTAKVVAHESEVNAIAFSPHTETVFITASADKTVALWDTRQLKTKLHTFTSHGDDVLQLAWSPHVPTIFASSSADRRVQIHDLSRIGLEQTPEEAEEGGPELSFIHGGHTSRITDISWNLHDPWTLASCSEDNVAQVFRPAQAIWTANDAPIDPIELE